MPSGSLPPLPLMLPPAPNLNTFPSTTGVRDADFFDQNGFLPDMDIVKTEGKETEERTETGCVRTDTLMGKSQFLGLQNSEEYDKKYHSIQTGNNNNNNNSKNFYNVESAGSQLKSTPKQNHEP